MIVNTPEAIANIGISVKEVEGSKHIS